MLRKKQIIRTHNASSYYFCGAILTGLVESEANVIAKRAILFATVKR